jgi:signal transduction histidine kinase
MLPALIPPNEQERLKKLYSYGILDTEDEKEFDELVQLVASICGTPMANISLVDKDRQWFKAVHNIDRRETIRNIAFCAHTILQDDLFLVSNALTDERFVDNPLVTEQPGVKFYAGMPLKTPDGYNIGSLCALDSVPRELTDEQKNALRILSAHVVNMLELKVKTRLIEEQKHHLELLSQQKSRLLSILAHDLRSPLTSLNDLLSYLENESLEPDQQEKILKDIKQLISSSNYLIENVMNWAGRKPGDSEFNTEPIALASLFHEISDSMKYELEQKSNQLTITLQQPIILHSDSNIIVFILRNILLNANKFTSQGSIILNGYQTSSFISITIQDTGIGMTPDQIANLFDWDNRTKSLGTDGERGSGVALLFCNDFLRRMGGQLEVESKKHKGSTFIITLPKANT